MSVIIDGSMTLHRLKRRLIKKTFRAARDIVRTAHGQPSSRPSSSSPPPPGGGRGSSTANRQQVGEVAAVSSSASKPPTASATKAELYEEAKRRDIPGRSSMTKAQLRDALAG